MRHVFPKIRAKGLTHRLGLPAAAAGLVLALATALPLAVPAGAQTLNERLAAGQRDAKGRMLVDAKEVVYDRDRDRVSAVGDVQIYYQGRVLEADRVTYDRKTKRVLAEGNARLTDTDGTRSFGDRFELTDDFRDGFIDSLRVETAERARFSSARAERSDGERTVFERGTYTTCEACKKDPTRPPLWQVKAARIIHNNSQRRIYYENATIEFWGVPVAWIPYFSSPDPSVRRETGFMAPRFVNRTSLGKGASLPFFWAMAPNYDLTLTTTAFTRQGLHGDVVWRHRLANGSYSIRFNGLAQQDRRAFASQPYLGGGGRVWRGAAETQGLFHLNEKWRFGWQGAIATDKFYFGDYKVKPATSSILLSSEIVSQAFLRGQGDRSWFDLTGYHFQGLSANDWQPQIGRALPSFDFDRRFAPDSIGGELKLQLNAAVIQREAAAYQALPLAGQPNFVPSYLLYGARDGLYQACRYVPPGGGAAVGSYTPGQCLLRGFAGDYVRTSADLSWRRRFIDPIGQEWTPFVGMRADLAHLRVSQNGYNSPDNTFGGAGYGNFQQGNFFGGNSDNYLARVMPSVGVEYRYPFFAATNWGSHHFEPIVQVVARPNETRIGNLPNEDAQSLIFDDTTLFQTNKFSGFDRIEGGTRANYGVRYGFHANNGAYAGLLFGQSRQLAGRNSFAAYDLANTGRNSGLDTKRSDYIASATFQPVASTAFIARARFDESNGAVNRFEGEARGHYGPVSISALYSRIAPQPELGYPLRREGLLFTSTVRLPNNFYVAGSIQLDLDRYLTERATYLASLSGPSPLAGYNSTRFRPTASVLALGYRDECTDFSVSYSRALTENVSGGTRWTNTFLMRLELRELGAVNQSVRTTGN